MPTAFNEAFRRVKELVADFNANEFYFLSPPYSEAQARKDFIDKFFIALGWDVKNPYDCLMAAAGGVFKDADSSLTVKSPIFDYKNFERLEHEGWQKFGGRLQKLSGKLASR